MLPLHALTSPHPPSYLSMQLVDEPLPRPPIEVGLLPHWLFINGVQPVVPENAQVAGAAATALSRSSAKRVLMSASAAAEEPAAMVAANGRVTAAAAKGPTATPGIPPPHVS